MMLQRGQLWWADLGKPRGSQPAYRRPVLIIQADAFNRSKLNTVVVASLTTNLNLALAPGNVVCRPGTSGLPGVSVVNVSQITTLDRCFLVERIGTLSAESVSRVEDGLRLVLGL
jgi:mRNA interferase MazF